MKMINMETLNLIVLVFSATSAFWFGFFSFYTDFIKNKEKKKIEKIFKDKKW